MQIPLANIHWRFLLVRDDWGFQVNPLCRHDITRSDRQIGNVTYNLHSYRNSSLTQNKTNKQTKKQQPHAVITI